MADVAARREARRRRILENSQNRLQLISGKSSEDCLKGPSIAFPIPESYTESSAHDTCSTSLLSSSSLNNGAVVSEPESENLLSTHEDYVAAGDRQNRQIANDLAALASPPPEAQKSVRDKLISSKYDIVFLSLLIQLISSLSLVPVDSTYVFLPLIIYSVTKICWVPRESKSNIANVFLLMNGMSANKANTIMNAMQWVSVISQDVCVYLFTAVCFQFLCISIKDLIT